jgi:carboxyl-terminal processing protease
MHAVARRAGSIVLTAMIIAGPGLSCARFGKVNESPIQRTASNAPTYLAQFDALWMRFDALYPSFEYKGVDWKAQRALYRGRVQRARSQAEFVALAREMLGPLRDLHIWFVDPRGQTVPTFTPTRVANFDAVRWQRALRDAGYVQRGGDFGEANVGGYGYLFIGGWNGSVDVSALDLTLLRLRESPGLIIDLRTNGGGSDATALAFASRFTTRSFAASYVQVRNGPRHNDLEVPTARTVSPRGPWQYLRPVVIIAGRAGFSATESFVAAMRTLPNVTIIGDTTGGASGSPATFPLGNGWSYTIPQWIEFGPDHQPIEWRGVPPHVVLAWAPSLYDRDRDPLIDAAVGLLGERNGLFRMAPVGSGSDDAVTKTPARDHPGHR